MILEGKRILITGVLTPRSIAFAIARRATEEGASICLSSFGRAARLTERSADRLKPRPSVIPLDVTKDRDFLALGDNLPRGWRGLDGVVHSIAFAPRGCVGGNFLTASWPMVAQTLEISAYSLAAIARATVPLMRAEGSIVAIDFDADRAIPGYDWMGVAKSTLESSARYLAACLGPRQIRVNLVCAGPLNTAAASIFGGPARMGAEWSQRSPLGWDWNNAEPVAQACVALLSDWFPATTGERIHVDGGAHAVACSSPGPGSSLP